MAGIPANIGDWSLARIFVEGRRLLTNFFGDMLLVMLFFTFPASLIKVCHAQFTGPQGSTGPEPVSIWTMLLHSSIDGVSQLLCVAGIPVTFQVMRDKIYADGHSQSFFTTLKLAFSPHKAPAESQPGYFEACSPGKFWKAFAAIALFYVLYAVISTSGTNFTPEAVAEMGLPPWTIFVFTLLITVITALSVSYFHLTGLLVCMWTMAPHTPIFM